MSRPQNPKVTYWYDFVDQVAKSNGWSDPQRDNFASEMCLALHTGKLKSRDNSGFLSDSPALPLPVGTVYVGTDDAVAWMRTVGPFVWDSTPKQYAQKLPRQEEAILVIIQDLGFDPKAFPKPNLGHHDSEKSKIREHALQQKDLFSSKRVFNSAWQRLRDSDKIVDAP